MQKELRCRTKIQIISAGISVAPILYVFISSLFKPNEGGVFITYIWPIFVLLFILFFVYGLWWGVRISVLINKDGVRVAGMDFVPWADIKKMDIIPFNKSIVIGVMTYDPEKIEKMKSRIFKAFEYTPNLPKRDFHISLEGINKKPEEVLNVIKLYKEIEGSD